MDFFYLRASFKPKDIGRRFPQIVSDFPDDFFPPPWKAASPQAYVDDPSVMRVTVSKSVKPTSIMSSGRIVSPWFIGNEQILDFLEERLDYHVLKRPLSVTFKDRTRQYYVFKLKEESFFDWFDPEACEAGFKQNKYHTSPYLYDGEHIRENQILGLTRTGKEYWSTRFDPDKPYRDRSRSLRALAPEGSNGHSMITKLGLREGLKPPPIICLDHLVLCSKEFEEACWKQGFTGMTIFPLLGDDYSYDDDGVMVFKGADRI